MEQPTLFGGVDAVDSATGHTTVGGPAMHVLRGDSAPANGVAEGVGVTTPPLDGQPFRSGIPYLVALGARCYAQGLDDGTNNIKPLNGITLMALATNALQCPQPPEDLVSALQTIYEAAHRLGQRMRPPRTPMQRGGPRL